MIACIALAVAAPLSAQTAAPSLTAEAATPLASEIAAKLFPDGTYRKMLGPQMTQMLSGMTDGVGGMPMGPLLKAAGLPEVDAAKLDKTTMDQIMAIVDPAYKQRMRLMMDGMFAAMIPLFEKLEPDLRAGLAVSLDHRFSATQLAELRGFFATPTGNAFAAQQMLLFMDPAVMGRMQAAMPKIMAGMPQLIATAVKTNDRLPKAKKYEDLTPAERTKLAALLGVDEGKSRK